MATTESKSATKTTEFYAYVAATVGVLLAGLLTKAGDGHDDRPQAVGARCRSRLAA
jgi:hypothetical protein